MKLSDHPGHFSDLAIVEEDLKGEYDFDVSAQIAATEAKYRAEHENDFLNIWVAGAEMVSIPIKTARQRAIYNKTDSGERDGDVFIAKMNKPINVPKG